MHREILRNLLKLYSPWDEAEHAMLVRTRDFIAAHADCFERSQAAGHITGSAWIVDPQRSQVVMIHHRVLRRWFQPGGHSDGEPNTVRVARKEAEEETGLTRLQPLGPGPFDVDVHQIPARGKEAAHYHYDIRFLFEASLEDSLVINSETAAVAWVDLDQALIQNPDRSIERMVDKTRDKSFLGRFRPYTISG